MQETFLDAYAKYKSKVERNYDMQLWYSTKYYKILKLS